MGGKTKRPKFAEGVQTATGGEVRRFLPSHVRADHGTNGRYLAYATMPEIAKFIGGRCCFPPAKVEKRLRSLLSEGQIDPVKVSISGTGHPDLVIGFLRHCAFLLAEVRGVLDKIPGAKGMKFAGLRAEVVKAPEGLGAQAQHAAQARRNYAENNEREDLSPVDHALYFQRRLAALRVDGSTMTKDELAAEIDRSVDYVNRHLRLFMCLSPEELLAVHEGEVPMSIALRRASNKGKGNLPGPRGKRQGTPHGNMRRALESAETREPPEGSLSQAQTLDLLAVLGGAAKIDDVKDDAVREWATWANAPKPAKTAKKKAPPKTA